MAEKNTAAQLSTALTTIVAIAGAGGLAKTVQAAVATGVKALRAAAALGPYAPFAIAAVTVAVELRNAFKTAEKRMSCKQWAATDLILQALENGKGKPARIFLGSIRTSKQDVCWAKGQTRVDGRQGWRVPFTAKYKREDVLPGFPEKGTMHEDLFGRVNPGWTLTIAPVLGPWAIPYKGQPMQMQYSSLAPEAWARLYAMADALYAERPAWAEEQVRTALAVAIKRRYTGPYLAYLADWLANAGRGDSPGGLYL